MQSAEAVLAGPGVAEALPAKKKNSAVRLTLTDEDV